MVEDVPKGVRYEFGLNSDAAAGWDSDPVLLAALAFLE
jgi:hypothetical protein